MTGDPVEYEHVPLTSTEDCISYFQACIASPANLRLGLEYELILVDKLTTLCVPFYGERSLSKILLELIPFGYEVLRDAGQMVGLKRNLTTVSLEPGGQLEFSGSPLATAQQVGVELDQFLAELRPLCERHAVAIVATGYRPYGTAFSVKTIPRTRYIMMMPQLMRNGPLADGQKMTASMQVSLDYMSEVHAAKLLQLGLKCQPFVVAMFANSPLYNGNLSSWKSYRMYTWARFDSNRSGAPAFMLSPDFQRDAFNQYTRWAFSKPLLFITRQGRSIPVETQSFSDFLRHGHGGHAPVLQDWIMHLGTLYPEARLKNVIEMRSADTCAPGLAVGLAAFWKGLAYAPDVLDAALDLLSVYGAAQLHALYAGASEYGLAARCQAGRSFRHTAQELLALAMRGLSRMDGNGGEDRNCLLPVIEAVEASTAPADRIIRDFQAGGGDLLRSPNMILA